MTDAWNPEQYDRFKSERSQPFYDLLALVRPADGMRVVDLGCGTGELTAELCRHLKAAVCIGVDRSPAMLAEAANRADALTVETGDIANWSSPWPPDLIFSNAALQWVDDHPALLARLTNMLAANGQIAVQMPMNFDYPSHAVARELEVEEPFAPHLTEARRPPSLPAPEEYAALLDDLGYREQIVRLQVYAHHLESREQVVEWAKGTLLTHYEAKLGPELFVRFLERYRQLLLPRLRDTRPFFYPFKRILFWARR